MILNDLQQLSVWHMLNEGINILLLDVGKQLSISELYVEAVKNRVVILSKSQVARHFNIRWSGPVRLYL